jgi:hypothetical protein
LRIDFQDFSGGLNIDFDLGDILGDILVEVDHWKKVVKKVEIFL